MSLRLLGLEAENVKRLKLISIRFDPAQNLVIIGGDNDQGKSSLLDSLMYGLGGQKTFPPKPVRDGADQATVNIDLDDFKVKRVIKPDGNMTIEVRDRDGAKQNSPQALLDKFYNTLSFDPMEFLRMKSREQAEMLKRISGVDFAAFEKKRQAAYDARTDVNRDIKRVKGALDSMKLDPDAPAEPPSTEALFDALNEINGQKLDHARVKADMERVLNDIRQANLDIEATEKKVEALKQHKANLQAAGKGYQQQLAEIVVGDPEPIQAQLDDIEAVRERVRMNAEYRRTAAELKAMEKQSAELSSEIKKIDVAVEKAIKDSPLPVPGLAFNDDGVLLDGLPFEQASQSAKIRVSTMIGVSMNPGLRLMAIRDGSLLDPTRVQLLAEIAEELDAQVLMEVVSKGEECSIIISDGEVVEVDHSENDE